MSLSLYYRSSLFFFFFFFNDTATTEIYTLSLHDALPICKTYRVQAEAQPKYRQRPEDIGRLYVRGGGANQPMVPVSALTRTEFQSGPDRKSTRLNSSHLVISYAVFCLKKKKQ